MAAQFRLKPGDIGPVQQSPVTCGSACLTVARMLVNPEFAKWIVSGEGLPSADLQTADEPQLATEAERFAAYERVVMKRTNGVWGAGHRLNLPWPHAIGTPPWGAKKELEFGASRTGTDYEVVPVRLSGAGGRVRGYQRLVQVVDDGEPALLYIGSTWLPRHVVLILPGDGDGVLDVYDPASGQVADLRQDAFTSRKMALSGWDVPWIAVQATGLRTVRAFGFSTGMSSTSRASRPAASA